MEKHTNIEQANQLIFFGLILFLMGLVVGLFIENMANPRMALSAHLEDIMNGMFLMILGLIWPRVVLSKIVLTIIFWLALYATFANITATTIAALTGFGKLMPIAGGHQGTGITEGLISFLLVSLSLCMLMVCVIVLIGFYKHMMQFNKNTVK